VCNLKGALCSGSSRSIGFLRHPRLRLRNLMADPCPILIIGMNRSGTTLLSLMLDSHSRIAIPHESHFFVDCYRDRLSFDFTDNKGRLDLVQRILAEPYVRRWDVSLSADEIDLTRCVGLSETIHEIYSTYARRLGKDLWGDKTPAYISEIHILNRLFPRARFIHLVRDGRDVALSILKQWWGANDFVTAIRDWATTVGWARKMLAMLPEDRWLEVRFEDLVSEPEQELRKITDFLGIDFEPCMLNSYTRSAARKVGDRINQHHHHLRREPQTSQAFKWRQSLGPADQAIAFELAGSLLAELGYPPGATSHPLRIMRKAYHRLREAWYYRRARWRRPVDRVVAQSGSADQHFGQAASPVINPEATSGGKALRHEVL
jgi:hypothetical protein